MFVSCRARGEGRSPDELVARPVHGKNVLGFVRRPRDLLPELGHEIVDRARGRRSVVTPDLVEDLLTRDHLTGVRHQVPEQVELARGEVDALAAAMRLVGAEVDLDVADPAGLEPR